MINRDKNINREIIKKYFQAAKRYQFIPILYKADNVLKNTNGYREKGILKYIDDFSGDNALILNSLRVLNTRFRYESFKQTLHTDYFGHEVKKK